MDNVSLTPINYRDKSFKEFLTTNDDFIPIHFDLRNTEKKKKLPKLYNSFKKAVEVSNANLIRNLDYHLIKVRKSDYKIAGLVHLKKMQQHEIQINILITFQTIN